MYVLPETPGRTMGDHATTGGSSDADRRGGDRMNAAEGIHEGNERFKQAVREADSATPPSLYTRDGRILSPNGEAVSGSDSIAAFWQAFFELGITRRGP
jgi:hypothetical protein